MKIAFALLLLVVAACDKPPTRPDEAKFRAANVEEKCKLTEPRAIRCADELFLEELRSLGGGSDESMNELAAEVAKDPKPLTDKDRHAMHKNTCFGSVGDGYPNAVFDCWSIANCKKFAECVSKKQAEAALKRAPSPDPDLDPPPSLELDPIDLAPKTP